MEKSGWHGTTRKARPMWSHPFSTGTYLYLVSNGGVISCLAPDSGEVIYDDGRLPPGARFWSSPVGFEGRVLVSDDGGNSHVIAAGPEFKVLTSNKIDEPIWASPALSRGQIFIRGDKSLYAFQAVESGADQ